MTEGLVYPKLTFGHFASLGVFTDEALFEQTGVRIGFTTRMGGVSTHPFDELNLGFHVEDDPLSVQENHRRLLHALAPQENTPLIRAHQIHGTHQVWVESSAQVDSALEEALLGADAIGVICPDVAGLLCYADCAPVAFVAPDGSWIIAHAGWRGAIGHIASESLIALCERSGCRPEEVNAYIGPCIHACCFEVSAEIAQQFADEFGDVCVPRYRHVSLPDALVSDLVRVGVCRERIADVDLCTQCHTDQFYSYRASGGVCGRHGLIAVRFSS